MRATQEIVDEIGLNLQSSVAVMSDNIVIVTDYAAFYKATTDLASLEIYETDDFFLDYLDLKVQVGVYQAVMNESGGSMRGTRYADYEPLNNTLDIAQLVYGSPDYLSDLYSLNGVATDFEIFSVGKIAVPSGIV